MAQKINFASKLGGTASTAESSVGAPKKVSFAQKLGGGTSAPSSAAVLPASPIQSYADTATKLQAQRQQAAVDLDTNEVNRLDKALKDLRAAAGKKTTQDTLTDMSNASAAGYGSALANAGGTAVGLVNEAVRLFEGDKKAQAKARAEQTAEILRTGRLTDGRPVTDAMRPALEKMLADYQAQYAEAEPQKSYEERHPDLSGFEKFLYDMADTSSNDAANYTRTAKQGLGDVGQFAVDAGIGATQLAADIGLGIATGGGAAIPMALRVFGGSAQEARHAGADISDQAAYGAMSAATSVLTERIGNFGVFKQFGKGVINKSLDNVLKRPLGKVVASVLSEGFEELAEAAAQPILQRLTYDPAAKYDDKWLADALYSAAIGAVLGFGGAAVSADTYVNDAPRAAGKRAESAAGEVTTQTKTPTEAPVTPADMVRVINKTMPQTAVETAVGGNRVTNRVVDAIAKDRAALAELGINPNGKTSSQLRAEVRAAVEAKANEAAPAEREVEKTVEAEAREIVSKNKNLRYDDVVRFLPEARDIYRYAAAAQESLNKTLDGIAAALGFTREHDTQKSIGSIVSRLTRDERKGKGGAKIKDAARGHLEMPSWEYLDSVIQLLQDAKIPYTAEVKNTDQGYRGLHLTWIENGVGVELQLTTPEAWAAKMKSEETYAKWRDVDLNTATQEQWEEYYADVAASHSLWERTHTPDFSRFATSSSDSGVASISSSPKIGEAGGTSFPSTTSESSAEVSLNTRPVSVLTNRDTKITPFNNSVAKNGTEVNSAQLAADSEKITSGDVKTSDTQNPQTVAAQGFQTNEENSHTVSVNNSSESVGAAPSGFAGRYDELQRQSTAFHPEGANAARPVDMPMYDFDGRYISRFPSNAMGAQGITPETVETIENLVAAGVMSHDVQSNRETLQKAEAEILRIGSNGAMERLREAARTGTTSPNIIAMMEAMLIDAEARKDFSRSAELLQLGTELATSQGRGLQMLSYLRKMSPQYQLEAIRSVVEQMETARGIESQRHNVPAAGTEANAAEGAGGGTGEGGAGTGSGTGTGNGSGVGSADGTGTGTGAGTGTGTGTGTGAGGVAGTGTGNGTGSGSGTGNGDGRGSRSGRNRDAEAGERRPRGPRIRKRGKSENVPVEEWMERVGEELAERLALSVNGKTKESVRPLTKTILADLTRYAKNNMPEKVAGKHRSFEDRLRDLFENYENYQAAWATARHEIKEEFGDNRLAMEAFNGWVESDLISAFLADEYDVNKSIFSNPKWKKLEYKFLQADSVEARNAVIAEMQQLIADNTPSTLMEKFTAIRYMNMLGNLRTPLRNVFGNVVNRLVAEADNAIIAGVERMAGNNIKNSRTVFVNRALLQAAKQDAMQVDTALTKGAKYADSRTEFSRNAFEQGVNEKKRIFAGNKVGDVIEGGRKTVDWIMNNNWFGDVAFLRSAYARYLAGYLQANHVSAVEFSDPDWRKGHQDLIVEARDHAIRLAKEATFRQDNAFSEWVSKIGRRPDTPWYGKVAAEGLAPFRKTPANILVTAAEHSPIGFAEATVKTMQFYKGVKNDDGSPKVTGNDILESLAKATSGSILFAVGALLRHSGILRGAEDKDDKQADFDDLTGYQPYALYLSDGTNFTIDWVTPASIPVFMGAELDRLLTEDGLSYENVLEALTSLADPMIQMSMLQGVNDTLDNVKYSDNNLIQLAATLALGYLTQGLTSTLGGQIERTFEKDSMMTYVDPNSAIPDFLQKAIGKASAKVPLPYVDYNQIPYIDAWGRTESEENVMLRALNNLINPAYVDKVDVSAMEKELQRLYDATGGEHTVFPSYADKSFPVGPTGNKRTKQLTAEEYVTYATAKGGYSQKFVSEAQKTAAYKNMGDVERAKFVEKMLEYANAKAKWDVADDYENTEFAKYRKAEKAKISPATAYAYKSTLDSLEESMSTKDSNAELRKRLYADNSLSATQKELIDELFIDDGTFIPNEKDVKYTDETSFILTQMTAAAQKRWDYVSGLFDVDAQTYEQAYKIYNTDGMSADQKRVEIGKLGLPADSFYKALGKRLS